MISHHTKIEIPPRLKAILEADENLHNAVQRSLLNFKDWIIDNKVIFFREYTDHGPRHIEIVMANAVGLIAQETWDAGILTPADAAVLTLSVLLHDCAMHLTEEGFLCLIQDKSGCKPLAAFGDKAWSEQWAEFLREAKRFDAKTDLAVFGDDYAVRSLPDDRRDWTSAHYHLIGEFIRRHHPRLAHQIAVGSVPGVAGVEPIQVDRHLTLAQRDLIGLVARSHGISLRDSVDALRDKDGTQEYFNVHAPYLMALLRVADYLELESDRAADSTLRVRSLRSPLSQREWAAHKAVFNFRYGQNDPEAISITAQPESVEAYLRVKEWQAGIQSELDASWAVLGEVYGRFQNEGWNHFALKLRRVRSNLDNDTTFKATNPDTDYIPRKVAFHTDSAQLLPLLVGPLYQDNPFMGVRELLQNAVDAVNEMEEYLRCHPERKDKIKRKQQEADIVITLDKDEAGQYVLTISDNGIGMNADVICNYFLTAGASFRKSDAYAREFMDEEGHSRVARSGKFGIGALATFLIGDSLEVTTRHIDEAQGIRFTATLDASNIPLTYIDCEVGTTIRIPVRPNPMGGPFRFWDISDAYDWYCLETPSIVTYINKKRCSATYSALTTTELLNDWRRIDFVGFNTICWAYRAFDNLGGIICNGITGCARPYRWLLSEIGLACPTLYIEDADGNLPLTLDRRTLQNRLPFEQELATDIIRDWIAHILVNLPPLNSQDSVFVLDTTMFGAFTSYLELARLQNRNKHVLPFYCSRNGVALSSSENIFSTPSLTILINPDLPSLNGEAVASARDISVTDNFLPLICTDSDLNRAFARIAMSGFCGIRAWIPDAYPMRETPAVPSNEDTNTYKPFHISAQKLSHSSIRNVGECLAASETFTKIAQRLNRQAEEKHSSSGLPILVEAYASTKSEKFSEGHTLFAEVWRDIIRNPIIPYNVEERKQKLGHAYNVLRPYIEKHEAKRAERERRGNS